MATTYKTSDELEALLQQLSKNPTYTGKTAEQIKAQAENEYSSYYDQLRLAAQQKYARSDLALEQQLAALQTTYDKQREASRKAYAQAYSQADREILRRGMQRSSYGIQTLANIYGEGVDAQGDIDEQQAAAEGNLGAQRTQLADQLADQLSQYDASKAADILARIQELEEQDYSRQQDSFDRQSSLAQSIYQYQMQEKADAQEQANWQAQMDYQKQQDAQEQANWQAQMDYQKQQDAQEQANWQAEFDESKRQFDVKNPASSGGSGGGSSGGGGSGGSAGGSAPATSAEDSTGGGWSDFMSRLSGAAGAVKGALTTASILGTSGLTALGSKATALKNTTPVTQANTNGTVKTLQGPVNKTLMEAANAQSGLTGITFKSALEEALKKNK